MNKNILIIISLSLILSACEIITIGNKYPVKRKVVVHQNQTTPLGVYLLFKTEIDSNNAYAASDLLASQEGEKYLAYQRYELSNAVDMLRRNIQFMPITNIKTDTMSGMIVRHQIELDLIKYMTVYTKKIDSLWYVTKYQIDN